MHERIIGLYEENAAAWDRQRGNRGGDREPFEKPWLDRFLGLLPETPEVLDIGCGMAEPIAAYLIGRGARITGIDSSPSLIALCRERFPEHRWIVEDMRALDLGRAFDGLLAWHSFFHLHPDHQRPMFARFAAHSRPGAALMFTSGPEEGESLGSWQGEPLYHGSLSPEEYRQLLAENGFEMIDHRVRDPGCGEATIWLARRTGE
ncbi:MAG TPA: class I SAM-dependent methyltransferase [Allosphingosinicella sp.]|jgi:SAM-dependent methyltransferase|nr:class I SAM-dependent methyltransferase [Allosphingosinicella sp.]